MVSVKVASVAGALALFATVANAADMPGLPPVYMPPVEEFVPSGWYLRGDIGMTNQQFKGLHQRLYDVPGTSVEAVGMGWDSSMLFGMGVGYKFNDWFRVDVTGEYRGKANFHGSDNVTFTGGRGVLTVGSPADVIQFSWAPGDLTLKINRVLTGGRDAGP